MDGFVVSFGRSWIPLIQCFADVNGTDHQELLELEEASLLKEKRQLQAEILAVEELLGGLVEAEGDMFDATQRDHSCCCCSVPLARSISIGQSCPSATTMLFRDAFVAISRKRNRTAVYSELTATEYRCNVVQGAE